MCVLFSSCYEFCRHCACCPSCRTLCCECCLFCDLCTSCCRRYCYSCRFCSPESPDAAVATTVSLVRASSPVPQEDSFVPLSRFFSGPTISGSIHPRVGEVVCPTPEEMGRNSQKAVPEKETGGTSKTSLCFSRFLPNFTETFSRLETSHPPTQGEFSVIIVVFVFLLFFFFLFFL